MELGEIPIQRTLGTKGRLARTRAAERPGATPKIERQQFAIVRRLGWSNIDGHDMCHGAMLSRQAACRSNFTNVKVRESGHSATDGTPQAGCVHATRVVGSTSVPVSTHASAPSTSAA